MIDLWKDKNWGPMLLKEVSSPFDSENHIFELKFDGIRAIIFANKRGIKIQSRNKQDLTNLFPELGSIKNLVEGNVIFDGEIVAFDEGNPSFSKIQERLHLKSTPKIENAKKDNPVTFVAFDILYENKNLVDLDLMKRKEVLKKYKDDDFFVKTKMIDGKGKKLFESVKKLNLEGIVAKSKTGKYHISRRTDDFIKIKNIQRDEFIIGGFIEKKNGIISLALGEMVDGRLHFIGKASISRKHGLYEKVKSAKRSKNPFCDFEEKIEFIKTGIKCQVEYLERTKSNHLRHPVVKDI